MKAKVAMIGVYPPPVGGISIHIQRLTDYLDKKGIAYTIYDNTSGEKSKPYKYVGNLEKWCLQYLFTAKEQVIHCHFLRWQVRFLLALLKLRGKRIVFTFHSFRPDEKIGFLKKMMIHMTGRLGDCFICVSDRIAEDLKTVGLPEDKIKVIPAFIPPDLDQDFKIRDDVAKFIDQGSPLLVANGVIGNFYLGEDMYGVDLCIELVNRLKKDFPSIKCVFGITHIVDPQYFDTLKRSIEEKQLEEHFMFAEKIELMPLLKKADIMIRPTNTDGDAISVREAMYIGTRVVCSNAVKRPDGVFTFQNRNIEDLVQKVKEVLAMPTPQPPSMPNFAEEVVQTYQIN